jgi:hypothetical protein
MFALNCEAHVHHTLRLHVAIVARNGGWRNEALRRAERGNRAELDERILYERIRVIRRVVDAERAVVEPPEATADGGFSIAERIVREAHTRRRERTEIVYQSPRIAGILGRDDRPVGGIPTARSDEADQRRRIGSARHRTYSHAGSIP